MTPHQTLFLEKVNSVIEAHLHDESFSSKDLAKEVHLCRMQLYRKLRENANLPASLYIRKQRLEKACELLLTTQMPISEIAYSVGFSCPPYFTRCFKEWFGVCPGAFRGNRMLYFAR